MATLSVTNTFVAGTKAKASDVNTNFADIIAWASGNIQDDNFGIMQGTMTWDVNSNEPAIAITSSSNQGAISIVQDSILASGYSVVKILDSVAETNTNGIMWITATNAGTTKPALLIDYAGSGDSFKITNNAGDERFKVSSAGNIASSGNLIVGGVGTSVFGGILDVNGLGLNDFAGSIHIAQNLDVDGTFDAGSLVCNDLTINTAPNSVVLDCAAGSDVLTVAGDGVQLDGQGILRGTFALGLPTIQVESQLALSTSPGLYGYIQGTGAGQLAIRDTLKIGISGGELASGNARSLSVSGYKTTQSTSEVASGNNYGLELHCASYAAVITYPAITITTTRQSVTQTQSWPLTQPFTAFGDYYITLSYGVTFDATPLVFINFSYGDSAAFTTTATRTDFRDYYLTNITNTSCEIHMPWVQNNISSVGTHVFQVLVIGPRRA